jgi:hypothetical protein
MTAISPSTDSGSQSGSTPSSDDRQRVPALGGGSIGPSSGGIAPL